jgi:hypothetical protein
MKTKNVSDKSTLIITSLMAVPTCQRRDWDIDWFPAVDVTAAGQEYVFEVALPGFGLINTANITRASAWPKPESLPGIALPLALRRWTPSRIKSPANLAEANHS